ncbi:MAG: hypothetical protein PHE86_06450 [Candidatus Marinimicrobia bacterium]|nr:hypothetical protein [Candidatus Neomarinimicrobiota bacterium]MDD5582644.1 hypothetical protein [Candidatus Neomarinimicrobiota bacterium]
MKHLGELVKNILESSDKKGSIPRRGAATSIFLATNPEVLKNLALYWKHQKPMDSNPRGLDEKDTKKL